MAVVTTAVVGAGAAVYSANKQSKAAKSAANTQAASADTGIAVQERADLRARQDLQPFRDAGANALGDLNSLLLNPEAQNDFVANNPFFKSLADDSQRRIFGNAASRGKLGSGGTASALQDRLLQLGTGLVDNQTNKLFNLSSLGSNAAARQATNTLGTANGVSNLFTQQGNALAAGQVGSANAKADGLNNLLTLGTVGLGQYGGGGTSSAQGLNNAQKAGLISGGSSL